MPEPYKRVLQRHYLNWKNCNRCPLHETRKQVVLYRFGEDNTHQQPLDILFLGESPGLSEDTLGIPFSPNTPAGANLQVIINQILEDYQPFNWAITYVVACHPPENRGPTTKECSSCAPRLLEFIAITQPSLICTIGSVSKTQFNPKTYLKLLHHNGYTDAFFETCSIPHTANIAHKINSGEATKLILDAASTIQGALQYCNQVAHPDN